MKVRSAFFIISLLVAVKVQAQEACADSIFRAEQAIGNGNYRKAISLLLPCGENPEVSAAGREQSLLLLKRAYLMLGDVDSALYYQDEALLVPDANKPQRAIDDPLSFHRYYPCSAKLEWARELFNHNPEQAVSLLEICALHTGRPGLSLLELFIEAALSRPAEQPELAERGTRRLLAIYPNYIPDNSRSFNYYSFVSRFRAEPRWSVGISAGTHLTLPYSTRQWNVEGVSTAMESYRYLYDPHGEFQLSYRLPSSALEFGVALGFHWDSYDYRGVLQNALGREGVRGEAVLVFQERFRKYKASAMVKYNVPLTQKSIPFLDEVNQPTSYIWQRSSLYFWAGMAYSHLDKAFLLRPTIDFTGREEAGQGDPEVELAYRGRFFRPLNGRAGPPLRAGFQTAVLGGLGFRYQAGKAFYFIEGQYAWTPTNLIDADNRDAYEYLRNTYNHRDNDLNMHQVYLSLGIGFTFFKIVKKTD